jgi:hypothetical protein
LVVFSDHTENARRRYFRFYEWNALLEQAFRDERRFAVAPDQIDAYSRGDFDKYFIRDFNAQEHMRTNDAKRVFVAIEYEDARDIGREDNRLTHIFGRPHYRILVDDDGCATDTSCQPPTNVILQNLRTAR